MAPESRDTFADALKRLRLAAGLTQEALAERAGISAKAVSDLERGFGRSPRLTTVTLLADALRLDPDQRARLLASARPDRAPATTSGSAEVPHPALPRPLTPLFGRAGVIEAVAELVYRAERPDGARLLVLTGPGGVGKTRLAIAVAEQVSATFAVGAVFVDLAPVRDPALVLPTIARRFAVAERDKLPLRDRLTAALRQKHLLLLLDNLEHLLAARDDVMTLLEACPKLVVLVTSRVALRVRGEREYRVAPLELPAANSSTETLARSPAVAMFLDRAQAVGATLALTDATAPAVAEICRRLDGLPLAVELAAAWTRLLSPPALLARLEPRLPMLVGGAHDLPARQRTMRDTIAWSYSLLNPDEQSLFRRLSVFVGGCTPEAATAVCADEGAESTVLLGLAALIDRCLLRSQDDAHAGTAEPRLTMLETLREFGLEHLDAPGSPPGEAATLRERHARYFLARAEAAEAGLGGPDGSRWAARLEDEHDNVRAALRWLLAHRHAALGLRMTGALWRFWSDRGHLSEGRRWLKEALSLPVAEEEDVGSARVKALIGAAQLAIDQGAYGEAEVTSARAVDLARRQGAASDLITALNTRGRLARERGEYQDAVHHHEEALALAQERGDQLGMATALTDLGYAWMFAGDVARGNAWLTQGLTVFRAIGNGRGVATTLVALAGARIHAGKFAAAEALANEALALSQGPGDTGRMAEALWVLGIAALFQEQHDRAAAFYEENLSLRRDRGDEHGTVEPLTALAMIALQQGRLRHARALLEETLSILERYDDRWALAMSLTLLGHVALVSDDVARAAELFGQAAPLFQAIANPLYLTWCLEGLAGVAAARGAWDRSARLSGARDALQARLGLGIPPAHPTAYARTVEASRSALGAGAFAAAHDVGAALLPEQALAEAGVIVSA